MAEPEGAAVWDSDWPELNPHDFKQSAREEIFSMRKRIASMLLTGGGAALALCLSATAASAATSITVKVTGGGTFTASAATTTLKDGSVTVTCTTSGTTPASTASTTVKNQTTTGNAPLKIGTAKNLKFNNCTGPLGSVTATPTAEPYPVDANSTTNGSGQTDAVIAKVDVNVSMTDCTFTVTGKAPGVYSNSNHTLTMEPSSKLPVKPLSPAQLTVSNVSGCLGVVSNGDHPTYTSTYTLSPGTLKISSS
jgi:hypothetical protein